MARRDQKLLPVRVALSITAAATACMLHVDHIKQAINDGLLPVYLIGEGVRPKQRILVSDLELWLRQNPQLICHVIKR